MQTAFKKYDFVGVKKVVSDKAFFQDMSLFFIRDITDSSITYDEYYGENLLKKHVIVDNLDPEVFEAKNIKAIFKITEYYPETATFKANPTIFSSIAEITTDAPAYFLTSVMILCDVDCKVLGIDLEAPWPPKAA